jgi:hypothetical protein
MNNINKNLHPYWITGFSDAESTFSIRIFKDKHRKHGWRISPIFSIELHNKDIYLLEQIQTFFGVGKVYKSQYSACYTVQSFEDISLKIIPHFNKYPLLTKKEKDFLLFKEIVNLLNNKIHFTLEGIQKIVNLRASINKGLSEDLKKSFSNTIPFTKIITNNFKEINPNWLVGFVDGEGSFYVKPVKSGFSVNFSISQHIRDVVLLENIAKYLDCGIVEKPRTRQSATFVVYKFHDNYSKILIFFNNYSLQSSKLKNFIYYTQVIEILKSKPKLTEDNLKLIQNIKLKMNKNN